jgi:hypothetical protein
MAHGGTDRAADAQDATPVGGAEAAWAAAGVPVAARTLSAQPADDARLAEDAGNRALQRVVALARQGTRSGGGPDVEERIQRSRRRLALSTVRTQMEGAFRPAGEPARFRGVRVHADGEADSLNAASTRAHHWQTSTRQGAYSPGTRRAAADPMATHVVQQNCAQPWPLTVSHPGDRFEQEADRVAPIRTREPGAADGGTCRLFSEEEKKEDDAQTKAEAGSPRQEDEKKDEES